MIIISNNFDLRNVPSTCTMKVSLVSVDVAITILTAEEIKISTITDLEIISCVKKDVGSFEFILEPARRKFNKGDKILHVSYYRPKTADRGTGKTEYRLVTIC